MEKTGSRRRRFLTVLALALTMLTAAPALAEEACLAVVRIPAECIVQGEQAAMFTLRAEDETTPMPQGSSGTVKTITTADSGGLDFGEIRYDTPDVYRYTISRSGGETIQAYEITVMVLNDGRVSMVFKELNTGDKADRVLFADTVRTETPNTYDGMRLREYAVLLLAAAGLTALLAVRRTTGEERES